MEEVELQKVVDAWIATAIPEPGTPEWEDNWLAASEVTEWKFTGESDLLWRFVVAACGRELSDQVRAILAAGPLEDLLSAFGSDYIERVEELAAKDARFNLLLGGVWRSDMADDVWARVQSVRHEVW